MRASLLGASILALAVGACAEPSPLPDPVGPGSNDNDTPPETDDTDPPTADEIARDNDELAQVLAAHIRGEFALQLAAAEISESRPPTGIVLNGDGTGAGALGSLNLSFTYHCNDGTTAHLVVPCDGNAHHSHIQLTVAGSNTVGSMAMDGIDRFVDWEIRDLTLDKARFRGPDNVAVHTALTGTDGALASYSLRFDATYEQVRFMPAAAFPTYGTIDFVLNVERTRGQDRRVFNTTAQLVYGASGVPTTLTIDGVVYTIKLDTGVVGKL
jgi:hypothetical protein